MWSQAGHSHHMCRWSSTWPGWQCGQTAVATNLARCFRSCVQMPPAIIVRSIPVSASHKRPHCNNARVASLSMPPSIPYMSCRRTAATFQETRIASRIMCLCNSWSNHHLHNGSELLFTLIPNSALNPTQTTFKINIFSNIWFHIKIWGGIGRKVLYIMIWAEESS